jgi:hypothetical protein
MALYSQRCGGLETGLIIAAANLIIQIHLSTFIINIFLIMRNVLAAVESFPRALLIDLILETTVLNLKNVVLQIRFHLTTVIFLNLRANPKFEV